MSKNNNAIQNEFLIVVDPIEGYGETWGDISFASKFIKQLPSNSKCKVIINTWMKPESISQTVIDKTRSFFGQDIEIQIKKVGLLKINPIMSSFFDANNPNNNAAIFFFPGSTHLQELRGFKLNATKERKQWYIDEIINKWLRGSNGEYAHVKKIFIAEYSCDLDSALGGTLDEKQNIQDWLHSLPDFYLFKSGISKTSSGFVFDKQDIQLFNGKTGTQKKEFISYVPWFDRGFSEKQTQFLALCAQYCKTKNIKDFTIFARMYDFQYNNDALDKLREDFAKIITKKSSVTKYQEIFDAILLNIFAIETKTKHITVSSDNNKSTKESKNINICDPGFINHSAFVTKLKNSLPLSCLTGNQSLQEGLFSGKLVYFIPGEAGDKILPQLYRLIESYAEERRSICCKSQKLNHIIGFARSIKKMLHYNFNSRMGTDFLCDKIEQFTNFLASTNIQDNDMGKEYKALKSLANFYNIQCAHYNNQDYAFVQLHALFEDSFELEKLEKGAQLFAKCLAKNLETYNIGANILQEVFGDNLYNNAMDRFKENITHQLSDDDITGGGVVCSTEDSHPAAIGINTVPEVSPPFISAAAVAS